MKRSFIIAFPLLGIKLQRLLRLPKAHVSVLCSCARGQDWTKGKDDAQRQPFGALWEQVSLISPLWSLSKGWSDNDEGAVLRLLLKQNQTTQPTKQYTKPQGHRQHWRNGQLFSQSSQWRRIHHFELTAMQLSPECEKCDWGSLFSFGVVVLWSMIDYLFTFKCIFLISETSLLEAEGSRFLSTKFEFGLSIPGRLQASESFLGVSNTSWGCSLTTVGKPGVFAKSSC